MTEQNGDEALLRKAEADTGEGFSPQPDAAQRMHVRTRRDAGHSYLMLEGKADQGDYQMRMLSLHPVDAMLAGQWRHHDGEDWCEYEISGLHSMAADAGRGELRDRHWYSLMQALRLAMSHCTDYLLDPDGLQLYPEAVLYDEAMSRACICFLPGEARPVREQLKSLLPT